jgi:Rps23 Pro-64 3,4-dihydroxylase Tpa1-like proline 4-hydroxylase
LNGRLTLLADPSALRERYASARPFPHAVIDGLFKPETLDAVLAACPDARDPAWSRFENASEKKLGNYARLEELARPVRDFLGQMNSPRMLEFLEVLTGIDGLVPDPYFGGGALHQIVPGGFLKVHADFNWHPKQRLDRRLNVLVYLNRDWRPEYGGALELWDRDMTGPVASILPVFNRTVVFTTTDHSFHGPPHPLACPDGMTRKSVSLYYYSNGRPESERSAPHDTIFPAPR